MSVELFGKRVPTTLKELVGPSWTALVVWDVQYAIVAHRRGEQILQPLAELINAARRASVPIVYTQPTSWGAERESAARLHWIAKRRRIPVEQLTPDLPSFKMTLEGAAEWQIHEAVRPAPQDIVLKKYRELSTWLEFNSLFRSMGIKTVVVTGISSCGGIYPTARCMFCLDFQPVVVRDCICSNDEALHQAALKIIADQFELVDSNDIIRLWHTARRDI